MNERRIYITEAAHDFLDREPGTLRKWERQERLPKELIPERDENDRRYWNEKKLEAIKQWMVDEDLRPGKGLPHNQSRPDEERVREHLRKLRQPRK